MINRDFTESPEHRTAFYKLLRVANLHCFPALLTIPPAQFKMFMDSIVWAFKHTTRDVADLGLNSTFFRIYRSTFVSRLLTLPQVTLELIDQFANAEKETANQFFYSYLLSMLQDILYVLTDADHKSGFNLQIMILARLFRIVESGAVTLSLAESAGAPDPSKSNSLFLKEFAASLLKNAFPHVAPYVFCPNTRAL